MKTFKVPTRLLEAANRLKDNKTIYCGLDDKMKDIVKLAAKQGVLKVYLSDGCKAMGRYTGDSLDIAYCLPDDIEIVAEPEQTWWEKEGLILCPIEKQKCKTGWIINYPNGKGLYSETLGIPRCEGYVFFGFVHNGKLENWNDIYGNAFLHLNEVHLNEEGIVSVYISPNYKPSTATHTVWRKIEVK